MKKIEIDLLAYAELEITNYIPHRQAPACSNPDSPAFSDQGDDMEIEGDITLVIGKTRIEINSDAIKSARKDFRAVRADIEASGYSCSEPGLRYLDLLENVINRIESAVWENIDEIEEKVNEQ